MEVLDNGMVEFESAIKSERTKELYHHYLKKFLTITKLERAEVLLSMGKREPQKLSTLIIHTVQKMKEEKKVGASSIHGLYKAIKLYCVMNDIVLNWDKLAKILPSQSKADDRAITREEILKLLQHSNLQTRSMVLFMASGGMRIGALPELTLKDLEPMYDDGQLLACKVTVYRGTTEEYHTFITPEAYRTIKAYLDYRERNVERINNDTKLFKLTYHGMRLAVFRLVRKAGIERSKKGKRYEFAVSHSLRKFYKSNAEQYMKSLVVEILIGHSVGVSDAYYKPTNKELLQEYLKAIPVLTFIEAMKVETEKDKEFQEMRKQFEEWKAGMDLVRPILAQLAKEAKTKKFTFTSPDGKRVYELSTEDIAKMIEGKA